MTITELKQDIDFLVDTTDTTYLPVDKIRNVNFALDEATGIIIGCDGKWQFDDSNYTTLPIGTTDLFANQKDYSFDEEFLFVEAVEIKNKNGEWVKLKTIDLFDSQNTDTITDFMKTAGTPEYYDKVADSIFLYPAPDYSQVESLRVHFQRKAEHFTTSDTDKVSGIADHLQRFLSISASYDWAISKQHSKQSFLLNEKNRFIEMIKKFYSTRNKDDKLEFTTSYQENIIRAQ